MNFFRECLDEYKRRNSIAEDFITLVRNVASKEIERHDWNEAVTRSVNAEDRAAANEKTIEFVLKQIQELRKRTDWLVGGRIEPK